jgi:hypothetical protein
LGKIQHGEFLRVSNGDGVFAPQEAPFARIFDTQVCPDPALVGDNLKNLPLMASEDLATNIAATHAFVHGCFSKQPPTISRPCCRST